MIVFEPAASHPRAVNWIAIESNIPAPEVFQFLDSFQ
jgi:hypothetical protein